MRIHASWDPDRDQKHWTKRLVLADISVCLKLKITQKIIYFGENHEQKEIIQLQVAVLEVSLVVSMRTNAGTNISTF